MLIRCSYREHCVRFLNTTGLPGRFKVNHAHACRSVKVKVLPRCLGCVGRSQQGLSLILGFHILGRSYPSVLRREGEQPACRNKTGQQATWLLRSEFAILGARPILIHSIGLGQLLPLLFRDSARRRLAPCLFCNDADPSILLDDISVRCNPLLPRLTYRRRLGMAVRFGEATHPGPRNAQTLRLAIINPTSVLNKETAFLSMLTTGVDVIGLSETAATAKTQADLSHFLARHRVKSVWSPPCEPRCTTVSGEGHKMGKASGTAVLSRFPLRHVRNQLPPEWQCSIPDLCMPSRNVSLSRCRSSPFMDTAKTRDKPPSTQTTLFGKPCIRSNGPACHILLWVTSTCRLPSSKTGKLRAVRAIDPSMRASLCCMAIRCHPRAWQRQTLTMQFCVLSWCVAFGRSKSSNKMSLLPIVRWWLLLRSQPMAFFDKDTSCPRLGASWALPSRTCKKLRFTIFGPHIPLTGWKLGDEKLSSSFLRPCLVSRRKMALERHTCQELIGADVCNLHSGRFQCSKKKGRQGDYDPPCESHTTGTQRLVTQLRRLQSLDRKLKKFLHHIPPTSGRTLHCSSFALRLIAP